MLRQNSQAKDNPVGKIKDKGGTQVGKERQAQRRRDGSAEQDFFQSFIHGYAIAG